MTDSERDSLLTEDNPIGSMCLTTTVTFGQRVAALSGNAPAPSEGGPFDQVASYTWWPDNTTCSIVTTKVF